MTSALRLVPAAISHSEGAGRIGPLPFATTPLLGRHRQVAQIAERLIAPETRLLTLTGPGGVGKSRLAVEVGHAVRSCFADGVQLVRLAAVSDPALVPVVLARALEVRTMVADHFTWASAQERYCPLVIDNFEHLPEAAPALVEVLTACPHVTMLVTSRVPLNVSGEHEQQVPLLSTPSVEAEADPEILIQSDAVRLFVDRAGAATPGFLLTDGNAAAVARIARQLDGLPLAIELAAARTKHLSPDAIVERLATSNDVLRGGPLDRPPHQRGIGDTIGWSYDLLDRREQTLFRGLGVFAGGFLSQAAAFILGNDDSPVIQTPATNPRGVEPILDACISLADKSLIVNLGEFANQPRFSMLMTIRSFASAELRRKGEFEACRRKHAAWFLAMSRAAALELRGPSQTIWLDWLEVELPNLRTALAFFREQGDVVSLAMMTTGLSAFWLARGHVIEGSRWVRQTLTAEHASEIGPALRIDLCGAAGWLALRQGLIEESRGYAEESLAAARSGRNPLQIGGALRLLGDIEDRLTNYARAGELLRDALAAYRDAGDEIGMADALTGLAGIALDTGDYRYAEQLFRQAIDAATSAGDEMMLARVIDALSVTLHVKGDSTEALNCAEQALELFRTQGDVRGIAVAMDHVGKCSRSLGDLARSWSSHRDSLVWRRKFGDPRGLAVWLEAMAGLLESCGAYDTAACVLGGVDSIRQRGGFPIHNHEDAQLQPTLRRIREQLPSNRFDSSWARGSLMSLPDLLELARAEAERAVTAISHGDSQPDLAETVDGLASHGLTSREQEVAQLLALRLSDKEIARRLSISPRTVSTHVTAILGKLGAHSRREVLRFASGTNPDRAAGAMSFESSGADT